MSTNAPSSAYPEQLEDEKAALTPQNNESAYLYASLTSATHSINSIFVYSILAFVLSAVAVITTELTHKVDVSLIDTCPAVTVGGIVLIVGSGLQVLVFVLIFMYRRSRMNGVGEKERSKREMWIMALILISAAVVLLSIPLYATFTPSIFNPWIISSSCVVVEQWFTFSLCVLSVVFNLLLYYFIRSLGQFIETVRYAKSRLE
jgi:hypothetical protein